MDKVIVKTREEILVEADKVIFEVEAQYKDDPLHELNVPLAKKIIKFISLLRHTGGALGGVNFQLLPFQVEFIIQVLAVVQLKNGYRKHKTAILFVPRKQGKTELLAAINLWLYFGDEEKQKEQYVIASENSTGYDPLCSDCINA